jgi:Fic family protein
MEYISIKEAAEKWGMSEQSVRRFCRNGKVLGAIQDGSTWLIPEKARRPRRSEGLGVNTENLPPLAKVLVRQKTKKIYHGLYDYVHINLTYSSSRMASNRLTRNQVETIFKKGKVSVAFELMKVSDVIEVLNHKVCVDYVLDHINNPLSLSFVKKLHQLLMAGTVDERLKKVTPGEFRSASFVHKTRDLVPASRIQSSLEQLLKQYEALPSREDMDLLDFHVAFERIMPFEDGNGRVGRLIMFKECLRNDVMPFIIDDKKRKVYLEGIEAWDDEKVILYELMQDTQKRFADQIKLQNLHEHGQNFLPEGYMEDNDDDI